MRPFLVICLISCLASVAKADPWLAPGDEGLRSDIHLLADAGILRGPVTTWPISWPDIARDVRAVSDADLDAATYAALLRVRQKVRQASAYGFAGTAIRVSASHDPTPFRQFADSPREEGEVTLQAGWLTDHFAVNLQGTYVVDADDGKKIRADGSYVGINVGNFMISAGYMERWWGPGWDGSLILSTNARPIPSITLERNYSDPFKTRLLSWLGPWRASIALGEEESNGVEVSEVRFLAARVNFKPRPWLEFGLSRTAQWCGGERPCDLDTFTDMLLGRDNTIEGESRNDEPGNQMAGYDLRIRSPWKKLPVAIYSQWIGEDEAGGLPSKFLGQFGFETWGSWGDSSWRLRSEYSDTACNFSRETPQFHCAYRHGLYPQGYTYRGRIIGHAMGNDSRMLAFSGLLNRRNGDVLSLTVRRMDLNRAAGEHAISGVRMDLDNVELRYARRIGAGKLSIGVGYLSPAISSGSARAHGFASWQQGF